MASFFSADITFREIHYTWKIKKQQKRVSVAPLGRECCPYNVFLVAAGVSLPSHATAPVRQGAKCKTRDRGSAL